MTIFNKKNRTETQEISSLRIRRLVISAMFLALALVIRTFFRMYIPVFGESGIRISVHGIFSMMPAILFGPFYGAVVSGLTDFLGHFLSPTGAYIPFLTMTSALGGFLRGLLWLLLRKAKNNIARNGIVVFAAVLVTFGLLNMSMLSADGVNATFYEQFTHGTTTNAAGNEVPNIDRDSVNAAAAEMSLIGRFAITRSINTNFPQNVLNNDFLPLVTTAMIGAGLFVLLIVAIDRVVNLYILKGNYSIQTMPLLVAMVLPAILVSTLNTQILRFTAFPSWQLLPFFVVWLPRVIQSLATTVVITYFMVALLEILRKHPRFRDWIV
ncbi:MAG: folate family ECF transporter S component [Defluviitaleaceae bacterium]|nr:folate family ECF transporter S component [Defluviitaleaceae bacterium]